MYVCIYIYIYITHTYIHTYIHTYMPSYLSICLSVYLSLSLYIYIYMHIYIYIYIYIYIHKQTIFPLTAFTSVLQDRVPGSPDLTSGPAESTPHLTTNIIPTNIARLRLSGKSPVDMRTASLQIKIVLE